MDDSLTGRVLGTTVATVLTAVLASGPAAAHIRYVTDDGDGVEPVSFALDVLSEPTNAALLGGSAVVGVGVLVGYLWVRPNIPDLLVLRETLVGYRDLVPWMLRLSMGLPLVGAGFAGYYFSPAVEPAPRILLLGLGFLLLVGLATRVVAALALLAYLVGLLATTELLLAVEYVGGLLAIVLLGGGRPSADHMLQTVASTEGTYYGRVDPVHGMADWFGERMDRYAGYALTVVRVGLGVAFVYLGAVEKLAQPGQALQVVAKYDLTGIVPVDPGVWVLGAGFMELGLGLLLIVGIATRGVAAVAFLVFTLTLFGLPDDPVLAHVTMFGLASAAFTVGSGPLALDNWFDGEPTDPPVGTTRD
jgi:uncharacterized membrane protein YphA (DoxX/SURF4 family)